MIFKEEIVGEREKATSIINLLRPGAAACITLGGPTVHSMRLSQMEIIFTMEDEWDAYAMYQMVPFPMTLSDLLSRCQGRNSGNSIRRQITRK